MIRIFKHENDFTYSCMGCMSMRNTYTVVMEEPLDHRPTQFIMCKDCLKRLSDLIKELDNNDSIS